ncbi:FG-GAP-like repeat-containing protein [Sorangium sp. So ce1151]|uniref:FG-GAP-like repeat-containing protein n=1 Tax=Sorangium sp. So ce1151 TaxID=3133332 RepID=UPI003F5F572B
MNHIPTLVPLIPMLMACGCVEVTVDADPEDGYLGAAQQAANLMDSNGFWSDHDNTIPACWKTAGYATERTIIQNAIESSWDRYTGLDFTGWGSCPSTSAVYFTIQLNDDDSQLMVGFTGIGPNEALKPANGPGLGSELNYDIDNVTDAQIRNLAYHELGHTIGMRHERRRLDHRCTDPGGETGAGGSLELGEWDAWSMLSSKDCRDGRDSLGRPSGGDLFGAQMAHGSSIAWDYPSRNFCVAAGEQLYVGDFDGDGRDDLLCNQSDGDMRIDLADSSGHFQGSDWVYTDRNFCVTAGEKLYVGDFDGDDHDDLLCNQSDGDMIIDLANSSGQFQGSDWIKSDRNFCVTAGEKLYVGDFDGDDHDDLLCNQSDGDMIIDLVEPSDYFQGSDWIKSDRDFCVASGEMLYIGDFNGDTRDDILCNQTDGEIWIDYADSSGRFLVSDWVATRSLCHNTGVLAVADINGDGFDDLVCKDSESHRRFKIELADRSGRFDDLDILGNPQPDGSGDLGAWCSSGTLIVGQFNSVTGGGRPNMVGRADLLCNDSSSGRMSAQYDFAAPALSQKGISLSAGQSATYGPFAVPSGGEFNALMVGYTGNADLYVRWGAAPTTSTYDCADTDVNTSFGTCTLGGSGNAYVMVRAVAAVSDLELETYLESFGP